MVQVQSNPFPFGPDPGNAEAWALHFGATPEAAKRIAIHIQDANCTGPGTMSQAVLDQVQAIWDSTSLDNAGIVAALSKVLP